MCCFREHSALLGKPIRYGYRDLGVSFALRGSLGSKLGRYHRTRRKEKRKRPTHPREYVNGVRCGGDTGEVLMVGGWPVLITRDVGENAF